MMANRFCPDCENEIEDNTAEICPSCGCPLSNGKKAPNKKRIISIIIIAAVIACTAVFAYYWFLPANTYKRALYKNDIEAANSIYKKYENDHDFVIARKKILVEYGEHVDAQYGEGKKAYEDAEKSISGVTSFTDGNTYKDILNVIKASKAAYENGSKAYSDKDYEFALKTLSKVVDKDTENYANAHQSISEICDIYKKQTSVLMAQRKTTEAYESAATALLYMKDADLQKQKGSIQNDYKKGRISEAQKCFDMGDKKSAFAILRKANKLCPCGEFSKMISENADFRNIIWGDDFETAAENEDADPEDDVDTMVKGNYLHYMGAVAGNAAEIIYMGNDAFGVGAAAYQLTKTYNTATEYIDCFDNLKEIVTEKYGQPASDDIYKLSTLAYYSDAATSLQLGYTGYRTEWSQGNTGIVLAMYQENFQIGIMLIYKSTDYEFPKDKSGI